MQTQQAAEQIVSALRGLAGLARLTTPKDQLDLLTVYDSLQAEATGTRVDASLRIQQSQLPVLLDLLR
jgi:hypothetical protein